MARLMHMAAVVGKGLMMIRLTWLSSWKAYSVRRNGRIIGLVRCKIPLPFREQVEFA